MSKKSIPWVVLVFTILLASQIFLAIKISDFSKKTNNTSVEFSTLKNRVSNLESQLQSKDQTKPAEKTQEQKSSESLINNLSSGHWGNICSQDKVVDGRVDTQSAIVFFDKASCPSPFKTIRVWVMNGTGNW